MINKWCPFLQDQPCIESCALYDDLREGCALKFISNFLGKQNFHIGQIKREIKDIKQMLNQEGTDE